MVLIIAVLHSVAPMEELNEKLFPLKSQNETAVYADSVLDFDTVNLRNYSFRAHFLH